jgi:PAS domain S-box-containing protein
MKRKQKNLENAAERKGRAAPELRELQDQKDQRPMMAELYHRAEAHLRTVQKSQGFKADAATPETDPRRLPHELEVHQIELELQNAELRQTREELEAALANYTDLYDFAPAGYFTLAPDGTIRQVNLTGAQLVGIERSRLLGRTFGQLVSAAERPLINSFLNQVFAGGEPPAIDIDLPVKGRPLQVVRVRAKRSPTGLESRVVLVDITALKKEENKVRVSEIRYRRLFETAHDGVLLLDPATRKITDANPFMTKLLGYPHDQLVGKELFEIGLLKDETASQEMFEKLKRKHEARYENLPLETETGRHQEVEVVANLYSESRRAVIQCNIRDITQRKLAEQALRASEARYRILFELGPVAVYSCDAAGLIQDFNDRAAELWGRKPVPGESNARYCGSFKLYRPDGTSMRHADCPMAEVLAGQKSEVRDQEVIIERPDASRLSCVVNIRPLKNQRGDVIGAINCFYDITERKAAEVAQRRLEVLAASNLKLEAEILRRQAVEASLKQSEQEQIQLLEQSRSMQEQLRHLSRQVLQAQEDERKRISRELHDVIAQTLTGINVRLAALKKGAGRNLDDFDRDIEQTQKLVEDSVNIVHQFARELRPAVLDDLGLIPALHSFLKNFTAQTGVHTHLTAFAELEQLDTARRTILYRVAQEALTNVSRHAQASRVAVILEKCTHGICMKIKDNGKSFNAEGLLNAKGGKRLGLLGMRERLEMVGGRFEIESVLGQGTTVTAEMPFGKDGKTSEVVRQIPIGTAMRM